MLIKLWPGDWKTHLNRINQNVNEDNGKVLRIGNRRYLKVCRFFRN